MSEQLKTVFLAYAAYGARRSSGSSLPGTIVALGSSLPSVATAEIDGARFSKLVRAAGLIDARGPRSLRLSPADVDLAFARSCASSGSPASKRLRFEEFVGALRSLAARAGCDESILLLAVVASGGPRPSGEATVPDFVRFHDDKSTYTGVHARGGPTKFDGGRDLAALCDRSQADVRGVSPTFAKPR